MGERNQVKDVTEATTKRLPPVTRELVEFLDRAYPDRCPEVDATDRAIWIATGQAILVRKLKQLLAAQEKNIVKETLI
jgi:hypothetical protein